MKYVKTKATTGAMNKILFIIFQFFKMDFFNCLENIMKYINH